MHFTPPVHKQKFYKNFKSSKNNLKNAEYLSKSIISLPLYPSMEINEIRHIIKKIKKYFNNKMDDLVFFFFINYYIFKYTIFI